MKQTARRTISLAQHAARFVAACVFAVPAIASASALDQFKTFVSTTKAAKGEFVQKQVKSVGKGETAASSSTGTFLFARP
ncbi:MAG TPA: outer membrane lipoprotein carrier protein LolA, partial [Noviherbaspirillum sp.]|nr:outer membrane lipoprotein carrier protein LolA [Noviherbaspirillum sp.]